jgi:NADH-quinone oxidoreductase subunit C
MTESTAHETTAPELVHGCPVVESFGQKVVFVGRENYIAVVKALVVDGFDVCVDLTGVDYLTHPARVLPADVAPERFEVVVNLLSLEQRARLRLRVQVPESDAVVPSLFDLHPGTEAHERETFDMFGISFEGHPDMTRILMPEDWDGHPLRKDYTIGAIPVQFKGANS